MIANIELGLFVGLVAGLIVDRFRRSRDITSRVIVAVAIVPSLVALGYWASPSAVGAFIAALVATVVGLAIPSQRSTPTPAESEVTPEAVSASRWNDELD